MNWYGDFFAVYILSLDHSGKRVRFEPIVMY